MYPPQHGKTGRFKGLESRSLEGYLGFLARPQQCRTALGRAAGKPDARCGITLKASPDGPENTWMDTWGETHPALPPCLVS